MPGRPHFNDAQCAECDQPIPDEDLIVCTDGATRHVECLVDALKDNPRKAK